MPETKHPSPAVRVLTRVCLLCHSLTKAEQSVFAVLGSESFDGYTEPFLNPGKDMKSGIKLDQGANEEYISVCSPGCCFSYCCRMSPYTAFLLHADCVQTLQNIPVVSISMRAIWNFVRCIQPFYANFDDIGTSQQIRSVVASTGSADVAELPPAIAPIIRQTHILPAELQYMILGFAGPCLGLSLFTVLLNTLPLLVQNRTLNFHQSRIQLKCSKKMYVSYATIRDQSYISDISNKWRDGMWVLPCAAYPDYVVVSMDDLGVRDVCFVTEGVGPKPAEAPWYRYGKLNQNSHDNILITQNPFIVRDIAVKTQFGVDYLWDSPKCPNISPHQWFKYDIPHLEKVSSFHMRHVDVDGSLSGVTMSCCGWTNMSFHAHDTLAHSSKPSPEEAEWLYGDKLVWVYFPMSPGEKICGVWVITLLGGLASVAIYTTLGRSCIFRSYVDPEFRRHMTLERLNGTPDGHVKSIYYNDLRPKCVDQDLRVAVVSTKEVTVEVPENPPWPISRVPDFCKTAGQEWYHSQAKLGNVQSIDTCKHRTSGDLLGMLLHYEDGTREAVGQWRFDYVIEAITQQNVAYLAQFHLQYNDGIPCVRNLMFRRRPPSRAWVTIPMRGYLVWWFSEIGGFVAHQEDTS